LTRSLLVLLRLKHLRTEPGKPPRGRISISAQEREGWIELAIEDDGGGVDAERVKAIALSRGIINAERAATLSTEEIYELLFLPGFSTAETVSSVSGRGVGMDAIRTVARELGGDVKLSSTPGRGSRLTIHFPTQGSGPAAQTSAGQPAASETQPS
jgi:two-component system, chemotaxis family, sensor kinase CheA